MSSLLISELKWDSTVHGVNKHTHKWVMRRDLRNSVLQQQASLSKLNHFTSTSVVLKATMPVAQREEYKRAKFFSPLSVCFLSLSLDEEELGAKLLCIVAHI